MNGTTNSTAETVIDFMDLYGQISDFSKLPVKVLQILRLSHMKNEKVNVVQTSILLLNICYCRLDH